MKYYVIASVMAAGFSTAFWGMAQETRSGAQATSGARAGVANQQEDDPIPEVSLEEPMSFWMEKKLEYSKSLLEHLTKADFENLEKNANQMRRLGKIEGFVRRRNDDYRVQLRTFDMATTELVRHARRKNIEGANLAFNQLTSSCVACHVLLREGIE